jgi:hypothetical protein
MEGMSDEIGSCFRRAGNYVSRKKDWLDDPSKPSNERFCIATVIVQYDRLSSDPPKTCGWADDQKEIHPRRGENVHDIHRPHLHPKHGPYEYEADNCSQYAKLFQALHAARQRKIGSPKGHRIPVPTQQGLDESGLHCHSTIRRW